MSSVKFQDHIIVPEAEKYVLIATIVASSAVSITGSALNLALPALQRDLGVTGAQLLWIINSFALFLSALILVGGSLGDHYGRKRIFTFGIILFTAAAIACGLAPNGLFLIAARAFQGVGGALLVPGSLAILSASFPKERQGIAIGYWSTFSAMMIAFGPVIGGWLADQGLWRAVFFLNVPLALVALVALTKVPESKDVTAPPGLDIIGSVVVTLGLAGLTYGFIQAPEQGFDDGVIVVSLVGGVFFLGLFLWIERHSPHPIVPLGLFKNRTFSGTNLLTLFLYAALNIMLFFLPLNLIQVQEYSEQVAGFALLPFIVLVTVMSRWAGGLVERVGARLPLIVGPSLAGIGIFLLSLPGVTRGVSDYWSAYLPGILLFGVGLGLTVAPLTTAVMRSAPPDSTGTASGINNAITRTAAVLSIAMLGAFALFAFRNALVAEIVPLSLNEMVQEQVLAEAKNLAGAAVPDGVGVETAVQISTAYKEAFVAVFRQIMIICAVLCWISALMAAWLVEGKSDAHLVSKNHTG